MSILINLGQIAGIVLIAHLMVSVIRLLASRLLRLKPGKYTAKISSIISLASSALVFTLYFAAVGFILKEFGISLKAYLASASVIGLAIGFGSQGLVQDVVTGLTVILSDLYDVGDMLEISGQTGIVRSIGMRFTVLETSMGAEVSIPNRTVSSVIYYPKGYVRALADISLVGPPEIRLQMVDKIQEIVDSFLLQFGGVFIREPDLEDRIVLPSNREVIRVKFRLWPGRGSLIETAFKQEVIAACKALQADYSDWMVTVTYEAEKKQLK